MRLLIADDDRVFRTLLCSFFSKRGYEVEVAKDGDEAWRLLNEPNAPKLAVLDWMMPGLDGIEVCRKLRAQTSDRYVYTLLLTSRNGISDLLLGLEAGADGYLTKPFDPRELEARLRTGQRIVEAEDRLRSSLQWREEIFKATTDATFITDSADMIVDANAAACQMLGRRHEDLVSLSFLGTIAIQDCDKATAFTSEVNMYTGSGSLVQVRLKRHSVNIGGAQYCHISARDLTESRAAEEAIQRSEENFNSLVEHAPYGIYRSTLNGKFTAVNPALLRMLGYGSKSDLLTAGSEAALFHDPDERKFVVALLLKEGKVQGLEAVWQRKDGSPITVRISGRMVRDRLGQPAAFEIMAEDVTQQHVLEQQLRQAQKFEAIDRLVGGIAHDFNNVLMIVGSYADLILQREVKDEKIKGYADQILQAATRAASVTRQLLAFTRKQVLEPEVLNFNIVVTELSKMLPKLVGVNIAVVTTLDPSLQRVKVDRGQMDQIILNLAVNARDAMPKGGRFNLDTQNLKVDASFASQHPPMLPGEYVRLSVSDTGIGMDAKTAARIFEPFFTTKERGKGTGLGLASVYGIVKQSGGFIWVTSEVGSGTTFDLYFPVSQQSMATASEPRVVMATSEGLETILLVEDEAALRGATCEFLKSRGYTVLVASDGTEALRTCEQYAGTIDALLTDIVMPGMDGIEVATAVATRWPDTQVLYMSGYSDRTISGLPTGAVLLRKPFSLSILARKLRAVFDTKNRVMIDPPTRGILSSDVH